MPVHGGAIAEALIRREHLRLVDRLADEITEGAFLALHAFHHLKQSITHCGLVTRFDPQDGSDADHS
jgi:hypothetical protein